MSSELPYVTSTGYISKILDKIVDAKTPSKFTQDYLKTILGIGSSSARAVIPFMKRIGFLGSDGAPTELYKQFRSSSQQGSAAATALRTGFSPLFEANEYVYSLGDDDLSDLIIQITGLEKGSRSVQAIVGSFKALNSYADFNNEEVKLVNKADLDEKNNETTPEALPASEPPHLGLSYTINLNLPATSDIAVFDAIFKSLKEHLLK